MAYEEITENFKSLVKVIESLNPPIDKLKNACGFIVECITFGYSENYPDFNLSSFAPIIYVNNI